MKVLWIFILSIVYSDISEADYALHAVNNNYVKEMVSIRFHDKTVHACIGAVLGRRTIMVSSNCLATNIDTNYLADDYDSSDDDSGLCYVISNVKTEGPIDENEVRRCKRFKIGSKALTTWPERYNFKKPLRILVDKPLDKRYTKSIQISPPGIDETQFGVCEIYGWTKPNESTPSSLYSTVAILFKTEECQRLYEERLKERFPENFFCVEDSQIEDEGRLLLCDHKLVGVFMRKMPVTIGDVDFVKVNIYSYARDAAKVLAFHLSLQFVPFMIFILFG